MTETDDILDNIERLLGNREYPSAFEACSDAVEHFPECAQLYFKRAHAALLMIGGRQGLLNAVEDVNRAIGLDGKEPAYHFFRGLWRLELDEWQDAIADLWSAIELESGLGSAYYKGSAHLLRAIAFRALGRDSEAAGELKAIDENSSIFARGKLWRASSLLR